MTVDIGTQIGFAILRADGRVESGSVSLHAKKGEGDGMRFVKLNRWLVEVKNTHDITDVVFEDVKRHVGVQAAHAYGGYKAILQAFCERHQIDYQGIGVGTIKKKFTGNGAAKKEDMIKRCRSLGFKPVDSNEADALAILHVHCGMCFLHDTAAKPKKKKATPSQPADSLPAQPF
ncbi:MAG: crossover junction endodeoxyribonuclease RuvC [Rhodocyclaceae bacterium]|nr:crossover junction endodeoxyribonuclease RuvC [Rhodocyclaceae bacterium]